MKGDEFFRQFASQPPFSRMHPAIASFFMDYLSSEKVVPFGERFILNTQFPPYPSRAFDNLAEHFGAIGESERRQLYSVTLAVTNRCRYNCWHCYNAGRSQEDMPLAVMRNLIRNLQGMGAVMVTLSGGEPLLRDDLEEIAASFDDSSCLILNTTGDGLTPERARALRQSGIFGVGISLDSIDAEEHDRMRGKSGAFLTALKGLRIAAENGLYPYVIAVASHAFLQPENFRAFMKFASENGAREVHILEPIAAGKLSGKTEVQLNSSDRQAILDYQKIISQDDSLPILSTFLYLESPDAFGCGAGLTHLYIDGSGEVCPCNLVPLSFGNIQRQPLEEILNKMGTCFTKPRTACVGRVLSKHYPLEDLPASPEISEKICANHLPKKHPLPRFFEIRARAQEKVGELELRSAYNQIHESYDEFWLKEAAEPIEELIARLPLQNGDAVIEAGCGTGYATVRLARKISPQGIVTAADISEGMLTEARRRAQGENINNIKFVCGDALQILKTAAPFDVVFSSWVLGYIPLKPFFAAAGGALPQGGHLGVVVHKENSPQEPLEIFGELVAEDPSVLLKAVSFDFPRNIEHLKNETKEAGLNLLQIWEGNITFRYNSPEEVLEHLLKSGAGTAFYDALDPRRRKSLEARFLEILASRHRDQNHIDVVHDYISCIATKPA